MLINWQETIPARSVFLLTILAINSLIIGIGLGRGGEGAGSRAQVEELKGLRVFRNSSGYNVSYADSQVKKEQGTYSRNKNGGQISSVAFLNFGQYQWRNKEQ